MNVAMFIVGFCIFSVYIYFTIWNIFYSSRKSQEENYPNYYARHGQVDNVDMDGMGNQGRFPTRKSTGKRFKDVSKKKLTKKNTLLNQDLIERNLFNSDRNE
jgi:hypothetical protein